MANEVMLRECDILNEEYKFEDKITVAEEVATALSNVIEKQQLYQTFGKNQQKYVTVDGWNTLGTMLGCTPYVENVRDVTDIFGKGIRKRERFFEATVSIRKGDTVLSRVSSICSNLETGKENQDDYAIYSMAQTRAIGKGYRSALGWIIKLSGYESTPAEEMIEKQNEMKRVNRVKSFEKAKAKTTKEENVDEVIIDVTPESATVVDEGDDVLKIVEELCQDIKATGEPCRKAKLLQLAKKTNCTSEVIDYIKGMKPEEFKKYD